MLIEREQQLADLTALAGAAASGEGRLVFLGGEGGVGKSALAAALAAEVRGRLRVRRGTCDVGPAAALGALAEAVPERAEQIEAVRGDDRVALFRRLLAALAVEPTLLLIEDVHWADEATLAMLRFLGRRLAGVPLLAVVTFRDGEAPAGSPLRLLLGDLATAAGVGRLLLRPLSVDGVRRLAAAAGSPLEASVLHRRTGGNPFHVTEVLAGGDDTGVPATVRDAVLARVARRSPEARQVLAAAAVLAQPAELPLLAGVSGAPPAAVDECVQAGVLVADGDRWVFRHELARRSVEESLAPGARAAMHAVVLRALGEAGETDEARLAYHAAASGDRDAVLLHAPRGAERAARLGSHRQAAELYRLALRFASRSDPHRADLCAALSLECYLTDRLEEAAQVCQEAVDLSLAVGDARSAGTNLRWLSRIRSMQGRRPDAERFAVRAVETLEGLGGGAELAMAYANLAALRMQTADTEQAVHWGERAIAVARRIGYDEAEMHALNTVGCALGSRHGGKEGDRLLRRSLEMALKVDAHDHVARAYYNLASAAHRDYRFAVADDAYHRGLAYCEARDLDAWVRHLVGGLAGLRIKQGRYAEAEEYLDRIRDSPGLTAISRREVQTISAEIAVRRDGEEPGVLDEAWALAVQSREEQQMSPVAAVRAEAAWIAGRAADVVAEIDRAWGPAVAQANRWSVGELSWWLTVGGAPREAPVPVAEPWALLLAGEWRAAAEAWEALGCPLLVAYALGRSPDLADGRRAVAVAEEVGATAALRAILRDRQAAGLPVPHGPRSATRANPSGLTRRELEVLRLLTEGLSNPEIAARLFLSERTVAHHVSGVLQKLGEPTRSRAVAAAVRAGIVVPDGSSPGESLRPVSPSLPPAREHSAS